MGYLRQIILLLLIAFFSAGCTTAPYRGVPAPSSLAPAPCLGVYHIVGSGQTLYSISKAYGINIDEIMQANKITDPNHIGVGQRLFIPKAEALRKVERVYKALPQISLAGITGPKQYKIRWQNITLHHSATEEGNAEAFDTNHRNRGMGGLAYHFVIGNGTGSGDGEIEVGWRWRRQVETNRRRDIQICLVGDFNKQEVSAAQFNSLLQLIRALKSQYDIAALRIRRHKDVPRAITECPGKNFPFRQIKQAIIKR